MITMQIGAIHNYDTKAFHNLVINPFQESIDRKYKWYHEPTIDRFIFPQLPHEACQSARTNYFQ